MSRVWGTRSGSFITLCHPSGLALLRHMARAGLPGMSCQAQAPLGQVVAGPEMARACIGRGKPMGVALEAAGSGSDQDRVGSREWEYEATPRWQRPRDRMALPELGRENRVCSGSTCWALGLSSNLGPSAQAQP